MSDTNLKIETPYGHCFATFPSDSLECKIQGLNFEAINYFKDNLIKMFMPHGHPIVLEQIEPIDFISNCSRQDLGISISDEVYESEDIL